MPSILSADFANLQSEIERVPDADGMHLDVMDNHFVPNLTFGVPVVEAIRKVTNKFLDLHLMIDDPDRWAPAYAQAGAQSVTFHAEAAAAPVRLARELRRAGVRVGLAVKPATAIEPYAAMLAEIDMILIMTVEPGFSGQSFLDLTLSKIRTARRLIDREYSDIWLQVDGGISPGTVERGAAAGADTFVAGSSIFSSGEPNAMTVSLRDAADAASSAVAFARRD
jgi:ribulose-phosphate 3-epimerase